MKSFTLVAIATLVITAAALAAPHPGSVFERPVAVPVDQNDAHPAIQQLEHLQVELPPATIPTAAAVTKRPCTSSSSSSALPTATAVASDESQFDNPIQQLPVVTATATATAQVTSTAAVTSSVLPTAAPTPTEVPRKRKCIRYRVKPAVPTTTAAVDDFGYGGGKPGKTDALAATASAKAAVSTAKTPAPTDAYEQPAAAEPVAKNELGESSAGFKSAVSGAAVVVMMLGAGLVL